MKEREERGFSMRPYTGWLATVGEETMFAGNTTDVALSSTVTLK
jgi:hypothetical protein